MFLFEESVDMQVRDGVKVWRCLMVARSELEGEIFKCRRTWDISNLSIGSMYANSVKLRLTEVTPPAYCGSNLTARQGSDG